MNLQITNNKLPSIAIEKAIKNLVKKMIILMKSDKFSE